MIKYNAIMTQEELFKILVAHCMSTDSFSLQVRFMMVSVPYMTMDSSVLSSSRTSRDTGGRR